jgi:predicted metal-dependent peptidase
MEEKEAIASKMQLALQNVLIGMPHLAGLVESIRLQAEERVPTAGIFASGRLVYNPEWMRKLSLKDVTFVMAHELMHLMLLTHDRIGEGNARTFNVAHDLIINYHLEEIFGMPPPAGGLKYTFFLPKRLWEEFRDGMPLESLVALLESISYDEIMAAKAWRPDEGPVPNTPLADALQKLRPEPQPWKEEMDVLSTSRELEWYPGENLKTLEKQAAALEEKVYEAISKEAILERIKDHALPVEGEQAAGAYQYTYEALKTHYSPPWQMALQQWMEATTPGPRSYARPSRRGQYPDFSRPGRTREGFTLHIVLDTSGSMAGVLAKALGVIGSFCQIMQIESIHLLQCDATVTADDWVDTAELDQYTIKGMGGSDMSPAMQRLAEDPEVERAIVITDGYIQYPRQAMPYEVLWVLTAENNSYLESFDPPYGQCIQIEE